MGNPRTKQPVPRTLTMGSNYIIEGRGAFSMQKRASVSISKRERQTECKALARKSYVGVSEYQNSPRNVFSNKISFVIHLQIHEGSLDQKYHFSQYLQLILECFISSQSHCHTWEPKDISLTCFSNRTRIWRVRVALILTEVLGNVVTSQLCHNVWDVAKRTQVLQTFMSSTCRGESEVVHFSAVTFILTNI